MANLNYTFVGVNTGQLESSVNTLRPSSVYRQIEENAGNEGVSNVVVVMGPNVTRPDDTGLHQRPAESGKAPGDPTTLYIFLDTTSVAMRDTGSGPRPLTVEQLITHEMAHAIFPARTLSFQEMVNADSPETKIEERAAINLTDAVSAQMGMMESTDGVRYADNAGPLSLYRGPGSIFLDPEPISPQILRFNNGVAADMGIGSADGVPTSLGTIRGIKKLEVSGDTATEVGTAQETHSESQNVSDGWQQSVTPQALGVESTFGTLGGFTGTVFDIANTQSWSSVTTAWDADGNIRTQDEIFDSLGEELKKFDIHNTHPYTELDISEDSTGKITAAKPKLDGQPNADFSAVGQVLGSALGRALAPNNQFVQIAASTVIGAVGQKLAQVFAGSLLADGSKADLTTAFADFNVSIAGAGASSVASFLVAELGTELHLTGFGGQLFNAAAGGFTGSVASQIASKMAATGASFDAAIAGLDFGAAATNAAYGISALLGSYLGHELVPAQTHEGAVGGQLLGAIGSAIGISAAIGDLLGGVLDFILPGIGSLVGTVLGTLIGDAFGHPAHPAAVDLIDQAGYLYGYGHSSISASDGGGYEVPDPMAAAAVAIVNAYLHAVNGVALDHSKQTMVGYVTDPQLYYVSGWVPSGAYHTNLTPDDAVHAAALDLLQHTEVIGGDLLMKRAHQAFINEPRTTDRRTLRRVLQKSRHASRIFLPASLALGPNARIARINRVTSTRRSCA